MSDPTISHDHLDIRFFIGNLQFNILYIDYEAPKPLWGYSSHSHSSYEFHMIPRGKGVLRVEGKEYTIGAGTFYLTGPGVIHEQVADENDPMSEYCINFEVSFLKRRFNKNDYFIKNESSEIINILSNTNFWFGIDTFQCEILFERLMNELDNSLIGHITYVQSLVTQIILNAIRSFSEKQKASYSIPKKTLNTSRRKLVDNYFRDFGGNLTPSELARIIGTSVRQLDRIMIDYYSMTFKQKLTLTRLEHAKKLLADTSLSIQEICDKIGYVHKDNFYKLFKRHYGITPLIFRQQNKKRE